MTKQKNILVTGVTGALGKAVATAFVRSGNAVVGLSRTPAASAFPAHTSLDLHAVDLSNEQAVEQVMQSLHAQKGSFDAAVLTAGGYAGGALDSTTLHDLHQQFKLNFETAFLVAKPVFRHMMEKGEGRIFFIGSYAGLDAAKGTGAVAYALSKSLLIHFAALLNKLATPSAVRAAVIVVNTMDTPQNRNAMPGANTTHWIAPETIAARLADLSAAPAADEMPLVFEW